MRQVTQCPACSTQFRVVDDQLKISDGWVRCGRCGEVFDARLALVAPVLAPALTADVAVEVAANVAVDAPPQVADTLTAPAELLSLTISPVAPDGHPAPALPEALEPFEVPPPSGSTPPQPPPSLGVVVDIVVDEGNVFEQATPPEPLKPELDLGAAPEIEPEPESGPGPESGPEPVALAPLAADSAAANVPGVPAPPPGNGPTPEVSFVRSARRQAFWGRPGVRAGLWGVATLCFSALLGQVLWHERERVAAAVPGARPWLAQACQLLGHELGHWRQIDAVRLEDTAFVRTHQGTYRLEVGLHNTAHLPVAMPALELSLTNARDEVVLRRAVLPTDWANPVEVLPPQAGVALHVLLSVANPDAWRTSGYRVLVFYP